MKTRRTWINFFLVLMTILALCGCARYAPPTESYQAGEQQPGIQGEQGSGTAADPGASGRNGNPDSPSADARTVQAEFDAFTSRLFCETLDDDSLSLHFTLRNPDAFGISVSNMHFPAISPDVLREDAAENETIQKELDSFDPELLTPGQLFTYRLLQDMLETEALARGLELYYQPLSPVIGVQAQLPVLLAEYTFYRKTDVEQYLELLSQIDLYYAQLAEFETVRADSGLAPCDAAIDRILQSCKDYLIRPENSFMTETFSDRLDEIPGLTDAEKEDYKQKHLTILKEHFIPAYTNLSAALEGLKGKGGNDKGLCHFKDGKAYYEYLVASLTGTDSTVLELRDRIERKLGNDIAKISILMQNHPELREQLSDAEFSLTDPVEILNHLREQIQEDFPPLEDSAFEVKHVPEALESSLSPAFFLIPPLDSDETNVIYINDKLSHEQNLYTTLAHEGYPGHLYQSVYFNRKNSCPLHRLLSCDGYSEGWGLYCELYSYSFDNGLSEPLKEIMGHSEASIYALYALLDIHVNYDGWDLDKTADFLETYYGITDMEVVEEIFRALIDNPVNYLKYYTGYLEICSLKDSASETLGARYDEKAFHKFILDMEGAPFRVIKPYFKTWLLTYDKNQ